ncbi:TolC family protein [Salmonella enterica subsp. enterica serovar Bareilly]|nr:TolC family protein [Salmonella enterica subsp. enterica serovar Gaminara]EHN0142970.1 TolC family protein [Salmonella enterica]EIF3595951.1 TolC family protein [Salmonella enterica]EIN9440868.1 TolC family protein [Salmonella enterica]EJQ8413198.1 TolC family protein [Salmonella enterica subsp. enterica serovar Bareilly]
MERERLSLLPDINLSMGQQSSNNSSFKGVMDSSLSVGLSMSVYRGNIYSKYKEKITKEIEYNNLMIHDKRNKYLVDLYRSVIEYNYKIDMLKLYYSQLKNEDAQLMASKIRLESGEIAKIEYDIINLRKEELQNNLNNIESEVKQSEFNIYTEFNIPISDIKNISNNLILSCKKQSTYYLLNKSKELLQQKEYANHDLKMSSMRPSVSFSLNMQPPVGGTLKDITTDKIDFVAAINVTVPIGSYFLINNIKKEHSISLKRIEDNYDEKDKLYMREKENVTNKMKVLESKITLARKKIEIKGKEVDYVLNRFRENKETIMSYYRQLDEYEHEKIKLKKDEREYEFYKTYIGFLD